MLSLLLWRSSRCRSPGDGAVNGKILQVVDGVFTQVDPANGGGGGGGGFTQEEIEDFVGAMFQDGGGITWTYDDANSQISGAVTIGHLPVSDLDDVANRGCSRRTYTAI